MSTESTSQFPSTVSSDNDGELCDHELEAVAGGRGYGLHIPLPSNFNVSAGGSLSTQDCNYAPGGIGKIPSPNPPGPNPVGEDFGVIVH